MRLAARLLSTPTGERAHSASLRDGPSGQHGCAPNDKAVLSLAMLASRAFTLALLSCLFVSRWAVFSFASLWLKEKNAPPGRQRKNNGISQQQQHPHRRLSRRQCGFRQQQPEASHRTATHPRQREISHRAA